MNNSTTPILAINNTTAPSLSTAFLTTLQSSGGGWVQLLASVLIIYSYLVLRTRDKSWHLVLVHGIFALAAQIMQSFFLASKQSTPGTNLGFMLAFNEANWIIYGASIQLYSILRLERVIPDRRPRRIIYSILGVLFAAYICTRIYLGTVRAGQDKAWSDVIARASLPAAVVWGASDVLVVAVLIYALKRSYTRTSSTLQTALQSLLRVTIPRILFSAANTFVFLASRALPPASHTRANISRAYWLICDSYSLLLLLDVVVSTGGIGRAGAPGEADALISPSCDAEKKGAEAEESCFPAEIGHFVGAFSGPEARGYQSPNTSEEEVGVGNWSLSTEQLSEIGRIRPLSPEQGE